MKFEHIDKINELRDKYNYLVTRQYDMKYDSSRLRVGDSYLSKEEAPEIFAAVEEYYGRKKKEVIMEMKALGVEL